MRLMIIRHGDPDYSIDSLTKEGWLEADLLKDYLLTQKLDYLYCSPLGRAKDTALPYLKATKREALICDWLHEFETGYAIHKKMSPNKCCWDFIPEEIEEDPRYFDVNHWFETPVYQEGHAKEAYDRVTSALDALLKEHGYERRGMYYDVRHPNHDTLVFFCHFGVEAVLLSHLLNCSPIVLWEGTVALPSGVTEIVTEERRQGRALWRMNQFASQGHLLGKTQPAFAARFCECFFDETRHD